MSSYIQNPSDLLDEIRRRRNGTTDQLQQGLAGAMGGVQQQWQHGIDEQAKDTQQKFVNSGEELKRQLDQLRSQREAATSKQDLASKQAADARAVTEEQRRAADEQRRVTKDQADQANAAAEEERKQAAATEGQRQALIDKEVAAALDTGETPEAIASRLRDNELTHDVPTSQVQTAYAAAIEKRKGLQQGREKSQAEIDNLNREHRGKGGAGAGKPMSPTEINAQISTPRSVIANLESAIGEAPSADTGARYALESGAEKIPYVGGMVKGAIQGANQPAFEAKIDTVLAGVNNAMDRRVSKQTLDLWKKQVVEAAARGPIAYKAALGSIKKEMEAMQAQRESDLGASGYLVPGGAANSWPATQNDAQGDTVRITDGTRIKVVPRDRWEAEPVPGWRTTR